MTVSDQIRKALRQCGEPMTVAQLADANSWDKEDRNQASKNLYAMKKAGEIVTSLTEEKVHYALVAEYVKGRGASSTKPVKPDKPEFKAKPLGKSRALAPAIASARGGHAQEVVAANIVTQPLAAARITRSELLSQADQVVSRDRNATHGAPEDSFAHIAAMWSGYLGVAVRPHDVAAMMAALKLARIRTNPGHADNWVDLAGYAACGAEVAAP